MIRFQTGTRRTHWKKNCVLWGSRCLWSLESTGIHLIRSVIRLLQMFPHDGVNTSVNEFNQQMQFEMDNIRDFIILHYHV